MTRTSLSLLIRLQKMTELPFVDMGIPCITVEQLSEYNLFEINDIQYCLHSILMGFWLFQLYKTHLQGFLLGNSLFLKYFPQCHHFLFPIPFLLWIIVEYIKIPAFWSLQLQLVSVYYTFHLTPQI